MQMDRSGWSPRLTEIFAKIERESPAQNRILGNIMQSEGETSIRRVANQWNDRAEYGEECIAANAELDRGIAERVWAQCETGCEQEVHRKAGAFEGSLQSQAASSVSQRIVRPLSNPSSLQTVKKTKVSNVNVSQKAPQLPETLRIAYCSTVRDCPAACSFCGKRNCVGRCIICDRLGCGRCLISWRQTWYGYDYVCRPCWDTE